MTDMNCVVVDVIISFSLFAPVGGMLVQVLGALLQNSFNVLKYFWKLGIVWPKKCICLFWTGSWEREREPGGSDFKITVGGFTGSYLSGI